MRTKNEMVKTQREESINLRYFQHYEIRYSNTPRDRSAQRGAKKHLWEIGGDGSRCDTIMPIFIGINILIVYL